MAKQSSSGASIVMVWVADSAMVGILLDLRLRACIWGGIDDWLGRIDPDARSERAVASSPDTVETKSEHRYEHAERGGREWAHRGGGDGHDALHGEGAEQPDAHGVRS